MKKNKEKDFLEEAEKEKKALAESYKESKRQTEERKLKEKTESEKSQDDLEPIVNAHVDVYHPSVKLLKEYKESDKDKEKVKKISKDYIRKRKKKK